LAREAIAQRYRDLRDREAAEHAEAEVQYHDARAHEEPAQSPHGEQRVRLVVDGKTVELPISEVVKRAQVNSAIDNRLEEAKRIVAEAKSTRHQATDDDFSEERHEPQPRQQRFSPNDKLRSIVERIQVGDADEGQQALNELVGVMEQRARFGNSRAAQRAK
jgi:hypothetical protein